MDQVGIGDPLPAGHHDLYFFGGGQDKERTAVAADLARTDNGDKGAAIRAAIEAGAVALTICGGYQPSATTTAPITAPNSPASASST